MVFESAPDSKRIQSECRLEGVRQMMPAFAASNLVAISKLHRAPLSTSAEDSQGLRALMTFGSQALRASAAAPLRAPDQLMNTSMASPIMAQVGESKVGRMQGREAKAIGVSATADAGILYNLPGRPILANFWRTGERLLLPDSPSSPLKLNNLHGPLGKASDDFQFTAHGFHEILNSLEGRVERPLDALFPVSGPALTVRNRDDRHDLRVIQIDDGERKSLQDKPARSVQITRPTMRNSGDCLDSARHGPAKFS